jgi:hypothetical protein
MTTADPIVRIEHIRKARMCSRGARMWAQRHGLDYMTFLNQGYPASVLEATGDALGKQVAAIARAEAAGIDGDDE